MSAKARLAKEVASSSDESVGRDLMFTVKKRRRPRQQSDEWEPMAIRLDPPKLPSSEAAEQPTKKGPTKRLSQNSSTVSFDFLKPAFGYGITQEAEVP